MTSHYHLRPGIQVLVILTCCWPMTAQAEDREATAERLFREALASMKEGNFTAACPKLAESQQLDPAAGTLLYLGDCLNKTGRVASAWATFNEAAAAARRAGQSDREKLALDQAAQLEGKVTQITVQVLASSLVAGLEISLDGKRINSDRWGARLPLDPGDHTLKAIAPGRVPWTKLLRVEATKTELTESVPQLLVAADSRPAAQTDISAPPASSARASGLRTTHVAALALGGVGLVGMTVGTVFGLRAKAKEKDSEDHCWVEDPSRCSHQGIVLLDEGKTAATWANVGFIGGGVALAGAATLLFAGMAGPAESTPSSDRRARLVPVFGPRDGRLILQTKF